MPRLIRPILLTILLATWLGGALGQTADRLQQPPEFSVDLALEAEKTPAERIVEINQKIMDMQAKGETGPLLGDLYNDLGVVHAQQEEWPQARDAFIRAVQAKPYDPDFHRNLALVFQHLEQYDLAVSEFEAYRDTGGPQALDAYRLLGSAYLKSGDSAMARQSYATGLEQQGRTPSAEVCRLVLALASLERDAGDQTALRNVLETWLPKAQAWRQQAEKDEILDGVGEAMAIENNLLSIYLEDGQILEDSGMALEAAELYEKALELAPDRDELIPRIVSAYIAGGEVLKAKVAARLARQDMPEKAGVWIASGKVYEAEHKPEEALDAYKKAYDIAPETPGLRLKVGNLYMKNGQAAEGRKYLAEAIKAPDTPTEVVFNYGISLMREKKYAAATSSLQRVTKEAPEFAGGWLALAQCYHARKQYSRAIPAYQKALELQPDPQTAYNLGVTAGRAENWTVAVAAYDQALALDPSKQQAAYNRAVALMKGGKLEEADVAFATFLEGSPDDYKANLNHGVCLYKMERYQDAIDAYNLTLEVKETAEAWDNMGLAYQAIGDKKSANQCFKEAETLRGRG